MNGLVYNYSLVIINILLQVYYAELFILYVTFLLYCLYYKYWPMNLTTIEICQQRHITKLMLMNLSFEEQKDHRERHLLKNVCWLLRLRSCQGGILPLEEKSLS